jgi:hypothetical protein
MTVHDVDVVRSRRTPYQREAITSLQGDVRHSLGRALRVKFFLLERSDLQRTFMERRHFACSHVRTPNTQISTGPGGMICMRHKPA